MTQYDRLWSKFLIKVDQIRTRYMSHRNFILATSVVVGVLSGLAASLLKVTVQFVEHKVEHLNDLMKSNWLSALFPLVGVGLSVLILKRVFKGQLKKGVTPVIDSIRNNKSRIDKINTFGHLITGAVTVAFGGSTGLEAPIVATGSAIGSNTARDLRLSHKDTTLLLACGASGGVAAIFNSPIAGIIFALEVLLIDFNIPFFIPILISTATATVVSQLFYPDKFFYLITDGWKMQAIPFYVMLGIAAGFLSIYVNKVIRVVEGYFHKQPLGLKTMLKGGIPLCVLIFVLPSLYGEGYATITELLRGQYGTVTNHSFFEGSSNPAMGIVIMTALLMLLKIFAATFTLGAGGNGGVFGPSLYIGGLLGFLFAYIVNLTGWFPLNTPNFIVTGMAAVMAGVLHAPLTAIFLIAEVTGGYVLFVPLMIVSATSYFITRRYYKYSIYHEPLAEKGLLGPVSRRGDDHI